MILNILRSGYHSVKSALAKSRSLLGSKLKKLFSGTIDADTLDELEELLYEADLGVEVATQITEDLAKDYKENPSLSGDDLIELIREKLLTLVSENDSSLNTPQSGPMVIMVVGVNGNGKTTSVAKLAQSFKKEGKSVLLGATDTFRAAAIEQLQHWAQAAGVDIVKGQSGSDPAAVAFDAVNAGVKRSHDVILLDTAGRLQTKTALMHELEKMRRSCKKNLPEAPHETLLVIDAAIGQNAIDQAKTFNQYTPITGLILTKLDGTAKGGVAIAIAKQLGLPIKFIGTGENIEDLAPFHPKEYIDALFEI